MKTILSHTSCPSLTEAIKRHIHTLEKVLNKPTKDQTVIRFESIISSVALLPWLNQQSEPIRIYWQNRNRDYALAATGSVMLITDRDELFKALKEIELPPRARFWGGFTFSTHRQLGQEWQNFNAAHFVLPRLELYQQGSTTVLACQALQSQDDIRLTIKALKSLDVSSDNLDHTLPLPQNRLDTPSQQLWEKLVTEIVTKINQKEFKKVVLARQVRLQFALDVNPLALLSQLTTITSNCFCFLFQFKSGETFLGASPERLYRRDGMNIETEAVAGTRPRGSTLKNDQELQIQLKSSNKDLQEQVFVIEMIKDALLTLCTKFSNDEVPEILDWSGGHHLLTHFHGLLKAEINDDHILNTLHPTPAVAGTPTEKALQMISQYEPFDRGWYAAPVGFISLSESELCVAIRSGLLNKNLLSLYAGAGIVKGSQPRAEWDETENKMINFLKIFDVSK